MSTQSQKLVYAREARYEFKDLNEGHLYEFQVAVSGTDGRQGVWSRKSFPALPNMALGILLFIVLVI